MALHEINCLKLPPAIFKVLALDYFADFNTGMGPCMYLNVCFIGIWTEIHGIGNFLRSGIGYKVTIDYTGDGPWP
jgi:hypothetical protein